MESIAQSFEQNKNYEAALALLAGFRSNVEAIKRTLERRLTNTPAPDKIGYLNRAGLELSDLEPLNYIHISGTNGKGSTCAFIESILRHAGLRTGLYTSPHLVTVRERIKINGVSLSKTDFAKYFFSAYEPLMRNTEDVDDLPGYFSFLTIVAFHAFLTEQVDVAILEVGIGGANCFTNIIRHPTIVGITSIGLDHVNLLGDTLESIAKVKAGIMKAGVPIFTVDSQPGNVLQVLRNHAEQIVDCTFFIAPSLDSYNDKELNNIQLGIDGPISKVNAGLALQMSAAFLQKQFPPQTFFNGSIQNSDIIINHGLTFPLPKFYLDGLVHCKHAGRFQIIRAKENLVYYLDGAHTTESLTLTKDWFITCTMSAMKPNQRNNVNVLVFYCTGERDAVKLLETFTKQEEKPALFDYVIFCPIVLKNTNAFKLEPDSWASSQVNNEKLSKCYELQYAWNKVCENRIGNSYPAKSLVVECINEVVAYLGLLASSGFGGDYNTESNKNGVVINEVFKEPYSSGSSSSSSRSINVLITGSLHLVGSFLAIL